jgi:mitogen-activated protein kinase 1/3
VVLVARLASLGSVEWELPREGINLSERLGFGSQGEVFKAEWSYRGVIQMVAVKRLAASTQAARAASVKVLFREVRALGQLVQHKNIVRLHGACTAEPGPLLLVMGFAARGTLAQWLETGGLDTRQRFRLLQGIAAGLQAVHAIDILHLDLKPANVLINEDCTVKLCDYGLARSIGGIQSAEMILSKSARET